MRQGSLFSAIDAPTAPLLPGLRYSENVIAEDEQAELIARINREALAPFRFQGWLGKRLTKSFGWNYDFDNRQFSTAEPLPGWLLPLRGRAAQFTGVAEDELVQALLIRYDPGAGIGWHRDRPVFEHVVGISLGAPSTLRLRRQSGERFERLGVPLAPRSMYGLSGEVRHEWQHSLSPMDIPRWSITFRSLTASRTPPQRNSGRLAV